MKKLKLGFLLLLLLTLVSCDVPSADNKRIEVNFILNGGKTSEEVYLVFDKETTISLFIPTKEGYIFDGWLKDGKKITTDQELITKNTIFEACWIKDVVNVTFDLGFDEKVTKEYEKGTNVLLFTPERKGFTFLGWTLDDEIIEEFTPYTDVTLKALWQKNIYHLRYYDSDVLLKDVEINYLDEIKDFIPQKEGYHFIGWYSDNVLFTNKVYDYTSDQTLNAKFEPNKYKLTLIGNDIEVIDVSYLEKISLPLLNKEGYVFLGWYLDDKKIDDFVYNYTFDITINAKFEKEEVKELVDEFIIKLYNKQTSSYDEISLYPHTSSSFTSKYWHKIGIKKINDKYKVTSIIPNGESLSLMTDYDYVILAYPSYENYKRFSSIKDSSSLYVSFDQDITLLETGDISLKATFYKLITKFDRQELHDHLSLLYSDYTEISSDINLITNFQDTEISWKSSNIDCISSTGKYTLPFTTRNVTLTAFVSNEEVYSFSFIVRGKNENSNAIATGYFYTNFSKITEETIKSLDIMYVAFGYIDKDLKFTNMSDTSTFMKNVKTYVLPLAKKYQTKVVLSVNQKNNAFSEASKSIESINTFVSNVIDVINKYGFDGVDIDWECPTSAEVDSFVNMMKVLYEKVKQNNENHLVTAAIGGGKWQPPRYGLNESCKYLDYVNLMTYSMVSTNGKFQNALYKSTKGYTLTSCSIDESIKIYDSYGVPRSKILVGIAFYGIKQVGIDGVGMGDVKGSSISFREIYEKYILNGDPSNLCYDEESESAYIYDASTKTFISYDNERSIKRKCEYVNTLGLGGIMYWQDGHDKDDILLKSLTDNIRK